MNLLKEDAKLIKVRMIQFYFEMRRERDIFREEY